MAGWVAGAIVGTAVLGTVASQKASKAQQQSASQATDVAAQTAADQVALQREIFEKQTELQKPFREAGLAGQNRLMELLGIGGTAGAPGYGKYATAEFGADKFKTYPFACNLAVKSALDIPSGTFFSIVPSGNRTSMITLYFSVLKSTTPPLGCIPSAAIASLTN